MLSKGDLSITSVMWGNKPRLLQYSCQQQVGLGGGVFCLFVLNFCYSILHAHFPLLLLPSIPRQMLFFVNHNSYFFSSLSDAWWRQASFTSVLNIKAELMCGLPSCLHPLLATVCFEVASGTFGIVKVIICCSRDLLRHSFNHVYKVVCCLHGLYWLTNEVLL